MPDKTLFTVCGLYCDDCKYLGNGCPGCEKVKGAPFWTEFVNVKACPVYDCCVNEKGLEHCGKCEKTGCERFTRFRDPEMTDADAEKSLKEKIERLSKLR